jgi:CheY-like chemotaxis protein/HPt (histidine-containing phosphotransfer) domain-containing protein
MLRDLGCELRLADNGREALNAMRTCAFDVIFMDCQMPEMDGFEAVRRLRSAEPGEYETRRNVPVIALTANALAGDEERCRAAGFDDYLPKPFSQRQLDALLQRWLEAGRSDDDAQARAPEAAAVDPQEGGHESVLDPTVIERVRAMERRGAARLLERLVSTYLPTAAKLMDDAERALGNGDADALRQAVHTLKSSSANLGATLLSQHFAALEAHARGRRLHVAHQEWPAVRVEYERVVRALQSLPVSPETAMSN